jgi:5-methylcytosine-specific restriction endonuclease McrA
MENDRRRASIASSLTDIAMHATGGCDMSHLYESILSDGEIIAVKGLFQREGIGWSAVIEEDVARVVSGDEPRYFKSHFAWADLYRKHRGIVFSEEEPESIVFTPTEVANAALDLVARRRDEAESHGVSLDFVDHGYACINEARYFYGTQEWKDRASAARFVARYQCEECHARGAGLHVHHLTPIVTIFHWNFDLNFAGWKLKALCPRCHDKYHQQAIRDAGSYNFIFPVSQSQRRLYLERLRRQMKVHDKLGRCDFCNSGIVRRYPNR